MMVQKQHKHVLTAPPPARPIFKCGAGEGCLSVSTTLPTPSNQNQLPTKFRTVKYVLTRSSEFQENRRRIQGNRNSKIKYQIESTENPIKQISAQNDSLKTKTAKSRSQIQITQNPAQKLIYEKNRIKKTNIKNQYTHGVGKSGRSHLVEDRGKAAARRLDCRRHLLQRNGLCRHRRAIAGRHGLPHLQ
jgi:hypothetical protein